MAGCASGAAPRINSQIALANHSRAPSADSGAPAIRHHQPPRSRRPPADRPANSPPANRTATIAASAMVAARGTVVGRFGPANADCSQSEYRDTIVAPARTCSISSPKPARYTRRPTSSTATGASRIVMSTTLSPAATRMGQRQPYSRAAACDRQMPEGSQRRAAPSSAARAALPAPTPWPASRSIFTPASCNARSTPAWYAPCAPVPVRTRAVRRSGE